MSNYLRRFRESAHLTQQQLADLLDVTRSTIIRWEYGAVVPYDYHVSKLCELFHVQPDDLGFASRSNKNGEEAKPNPIPPLRENPPPQEHPSTYFVLDRSSEEELIRLQTQDAMATRLLPLFPENLAPEAISRVLDVGCGTGGWLIEVAKAYPQLSLIGVDVSRKFVEYARAQAEAVQVSNRVEFYVADALRMLEFPNNSFGLVHHRLASSWLRIWDWPKLLREYQRVSRGFVQIVESELKIESSPNFAQWWELLTRVAQMAGHFPDTGDLKSISPEFWQQWLEREVKKYFGNVKIQQYKLEHIGNTPSGEAFKQDISLAMKTAAPFVRKWSSGTEYEELCQRVQADLAGDFRIVIPAFSLCGEKSSFE